jgi:tetraspanin-18
MPYHWRNWLAKYSLCLQNFVGFVAGICALAAGIWIVLGKYSFVGIIRCTGINGITHPSVIWLAGYVLIVAGALVSLISFIGCWGAYREYKWLLTCYGVLIIIILLMQIISGSLVAGYPNEAQEYTRAFLKSSIKKYYTAEEKDAVTLMWDYTMSNLKCCGVDSYEDFRESKKWTQETNNTIPDACCVLEGDTAKLQPKDKNCLTKPSDSNSYWKSGCYNALVKWLEEKKTTVILICIGSALMNLLSIISTFCFCQSIRVRQKKFRCCHEEERA